MDVFGHLLRSGLCKGFQGGEALEQGGGDLVHSGIGTLGGQADGEQQFIIFLVLQGTDAIRVQCFQPVDDGACLLFGLHGVFLL